MYVFFFFSFTYQTLMMIISVFKRYVSNGKVGHVVERVPLSRVKDRLSLVKGALVECSLVGGYFPQQTTTNPPTE